LTAKLSDHIAIAEKLRLFTLLLTRQVKLGRGVRLGKAVSMSRFARYSFGRGTRIGDRCVLEVGSSTVAELFVGEDSWISHDCHIQANTTMTIGSNVLIGEFSSIRDTSHSFDDLNMNIREQQDRFGKITIEDNVWIGRGVAIIANGRALTIQSGAIIAANAVVTKAVEKNGIYGGVPARLIGRRA